MKYIKIKMEEEIEDKSKKSTTILERIISFLLPKANPDFDDKINSVSFWILEFTNENFSPNREIGLNSKNEFIMKMPYKSNYGYWTDNQLTYFDFKKSFEIEYITRKEFEEKWKNEANKLS